MKIKTFMTAMSSTNMKIENVESFAFLQFSLEIVAVSFVTTVVAHFDYNKYVVKLTQSLKI